jgi:inositol-1,3,4-trisphosphate 5/6-kinase/inositol-tetrakisphosphate 1-kinase
VPDGADYMVIDINYFPGFEKLPNYENLMVEFLTSLLQGKAEDPRALKKFVSFSQKPLSRAAPSHID